MITKLSGLHTAPYMQYVSSDLFGYSEQVGSQEQCITTVIEAFFTK
jgi:hypothetical protein